MSQEGKVCADKHSTSSRINAHEVRSTNKAASQVSVEMDGVYGVV